jgi:transcriptional regulator with XRE-family HTH domain
MMYSEVLAMRILSLCRERRITVNKLATLSGLGQSSVDNIKSKCKSPGIKTLHRIAQGFGMTLSEFLDFPEMNEACIED